MRFWLSGRRIGWSNPPTVIPAKAGIQCERATIEITKVWIPDRAAGHQWGM